jgi:AcrR family transcriptional regulator
MASAVPKTGQKPKAIRRGRPPRINREQIATAALELGLQTFSMQAIADRLGVTPPALYTHVSGRDDVLELVAADLVGSFEVPVSADTDWRDWLEAFALEMRRHFAAVGTALRINMDLHGSLSPAHLEATERGFRLLTDAGMTAADAGLAIWLVSRMAMTAGGADNTSVQMAMSEASRVIDRNALPTMTAALDDLGAEPHLDTFEFDLRVLLDGLSAQL